MAGPNERIVEIPWLLSRLGNPARALDVGARDSAYLGELVATGAQVTGIDTRPFNATGVSCIQGDAAHMPANWGGAFDLVTCVSVLDHVGLDAYGNIAQAGQLEAVAAELRRVTSDGGRLLVTMPFGRAQLTTHPDGGQRVFGTDEIGRLFKAWSWSSVQVWERRGDEYVPSLIEYCTEAGYDSYRADAVIALELRR